MAPLGRGHERDSVRSLLLPARSTCPRAAVRPSFCPSVTPFLLGSCRARRRWLCPQAPIRLEGSGCLVLTERREYLYGPGLGSSWGFFPCPPPSLQATFTCSVFGPRVPGSAEDTLAWKDVNSVIFIQSVILFPLPVSGDTSGHSPSPLGLQPRSVWGSWVKSTVPPASGWWRLVLPLALGGLCTRFANPTPLPKMDKCCAALFRERGCLPCPVMHTSAPLPQGFKRRSYCRRKEGMCRKDGTIFINAIISVLQCWVAPQVLHHVSRLVPTPVSSHLPPGLLWSRFRA